jgi:hypothetical protein
VWIIIDCARIAYITPFTQAINPGIEPGKSSHRPFIKYGDELWSKIGLDSLNIFGYFFAFVDVEFLSQHLD